MAICSVSLAASTESLIRETSYFWRTTATVATFTGSTLLFEFQSIFPDNLMMKKKKIIIMLLSWFLWHTLPRSNMSIVVSNFKDATNSYSFCNWPNRTGTELVWGHVRLLWYSSGAGKSDTKWRGSSFPGLLALSSSNPSVLATYMYM